jgi:hypothetical protein
MAIHACAECQKDVSDKASACPHCGFDPSRKREGRWSSSARVSLLVGGGVVLLLLVTGWLALARRGADDSYARVEQLRAEQDADGTHDQNVRQRFFRLYKAHPGSAMYIYLWSRCVDDAAEQLALAQDGIRADPRFSWNYNMEARALARLNRIPEAYAEAVKGAALDPGNMQLADKQKSLKRILDAKLADEPRPIARATASADANEKQTERYQGLFQAMIHSPDRSDLQALEASRLAGSKIPAADAVRGFTVCGNPFADSCVRAYVPRDARLKSVWPPLDVDVTTLRPHELLTVVGSALLTSKGETIVLADRVTVEGP